MFTRTPRPEPLVEITDAAGRVMLRMPPGNLMTYAAVSASQGSARRYAATLYMDRPRTRMEWRLWLAARDAVRAELDFRPFFV